MQLIAAAAGTDPAEAQFGADIRNGGPSQGSTGASGTATDSSNYASFDEMAEAYAADIAEIDAGDKYGNNIASLYNPLNYIGSEGTDKSTWTRIVMGAVEGDMPMMASLNLQIAWLNAGVNAQINGNGTVAMCPPRCLATPLRGMWTRYTASM